MIRHSYAGHYALEKPFFFKKMEMAPLFVQAGTGMAPLNVQSQLYLNHSRSIA
jgi:hypothetical protein